MMDETTETAKEKPVGNIAKFLLSKPVDPISPSQRSKVVIVGCRLAGVATGLGVLFKKLASELVLIDDNEDLAKAEAEDIMHAAMFLGNPKVIGTNEHCMARDADVIVVTVGRDQEQPKNGLEGNLAILKASIPNVCKYAPKSVIVVVTDPVDVLSYAVMKLSGFTPNRVIGLGTFLDNCRLQHLIGSTLGVASGSVQSLIIGESGPTSVPIWSSVSVMGMKLKDIDKEIGGKNDPEQWGDLHTNVNACSQDLIMRKGSHSWAVGICTCEIIEAILRNTCACMTVSTFVKGCRHGLEKDVFMSLPCVIGRDGVLSYIRHLYTQEEQDLTTKSSRAIYEAQKSIQDKLN